MSSTPKQAILCVDDERLILHSLRDQLSRTFGDRYRYELAESASEALEVITELIADQVEVLVIVSDWLMPNIRGDDLLIQIHTQYPKIIKILLTGQANDDAIERAHQEANLFCHLAKPWEESILIEAIRAGLENHHA